MVHSTTAIYAASAVLAHLEIDNVDRKPFQKRTHNELHRTQLSVCQYPCTIWISEPL